MKLKPDLKAIFWLLCLVMLVTTRGESYIDDTRGARMI
jgi:hypothetical protein